MANKKFYMLMSFVALILTTPLVFANQGVPQSITQLEESFGGFNDFLNDISNEVNTNLNNISLLQSNLTSFDSRISILQSNLTSVDIRISQNELDISALSMIEAQPAIYTKSTNVTVGGNVDLEYTDFCDSGDLILNGYIKDIKEPIDRNLMKNTNSIHLPGGDQGWTIVMTNGNGAGQKFTGVIVCLDTNP